VAFLARHGEAHSVPPHLVNYRANLAALQAAGATRVLALNTVGGIGDAYGPRVLACPDQVIDYTWGRISTLWEPDADGRMDTEPLHVDFGDPYSAGMRAGILRAARAGGIAVVDGGCYGATQGPRLETRAEIARLRRDGCDLVGMTGMPAALARELGLEYACWRSSPTGRPAAATAKRSPWPRCWPTCGPHRPGCRTWWPGWPASDCQCHRLFAYSAARPTPHHTHPHPHRTHQSYAVRYREMVQRRQGLRLIAPEDGSADVFAHHSAINAKGFRSLQEGQRVQYELTQGPKGAQASNIESVRLIHRLSFPRTPLRRGFLCALQEGPGCRTRYMSRSWVTAPPSRRRPFC
jgi:cold shock CspA family protein